MKLVRDKNFSDQGGPGGLIFERWGFDGSQKYIDRSGNVVIVSRDDIVVELYSAGDSRVKDELVIDPRSAREVDFIDRLMSRDATRTAVDAGEVRAAWLDFVASLPPFDALPESEQDDIRNLSFYLEYGAIEADEYDFDDDGDPLVDASDILDRLRSAYPDIRVSGLLKIIAKAAMAPGV